MVITLIGGAFVKIDTKDHIIAINPSANVFGKKIPRFGVDIAIVSSLDNNEIEEYFSYKEKVPFMISGPGEYEIGGMYIRGVYSDRKGSVDLDNVVYACFIDGVHIVHLGENIGSNIIGLARETLGNVDILFVPIGKENGLSPEEAYKVATSFEPKVIIPLILQEKRKASLDKFIHEAGLEKIEPVAKITLKKKDIEGKEGEVIVINPTIA